MAEKLPLSDAIAEVQAKIADDLFPLALSPFEKFVLWDETPAHPMTSFIELDFQSGINGSILEEAFAFAAHCHPLLASTIEDRDGELHWRYDPNYRLKLLHYPETPYLPDGRLSPIDLFRETGMRIWLHVQELETRLSIQFHHACVDGIGIRRMIIDALTFYAINTTDGVKEIARSWRRLEPNTLRDRYDFSGAFSENPTEPLSTWQRIKNAHYFHFLTPKPLLGTRTRNTPLPTPHPQLHGQLDRGTSAEISDRCRNQGIRVSNLAAALLFETGSLWNQRHALVHPRSRFRLLVPYDLRSRVDLKMPAANRLSFSFLGRTQAACSDVKSLVESISLEMEGYKRNHLPLDFNHALQAAAKHASFMRWVLRRSRKMATTVLTYGGDILRGMVKHFPEDNDARVVGDARLLRVFGCPPVREHTNIAIGMCFNWGQLSFSLAWNRDKLSEADAREFLELYQSRWTNWLHS